MCVRERWGGTILTACSDRPTICGHAGCPHVGPAMPSTLTWLHGNRSGKGGKKLLWPNGFSKTLTSAAVWPFRLRGLLVVMVFFFSFILLIWQKSVHKNSSYELIIDEKKCLRVTRQVLDDRNFSKGIYDNLPMLDLLCSYSTISCFWQVKTFNYQNNYNVYYIFDLIMLPFC